MALFASFALSSSCTVGQPGKRLWPMLAMALWLLIPATSTVAAPVTPDMPQLQARSWILVDAHSGQTLAAHEAGTRMVSDATVRLMTAYVVFQALRNGQLKADQKVPVPATAWQTPGNRMYLTPGQTVSIDDLLRGLLVDAANDAALTLAAAVSGNSADFVSGMNREAHRLGLADSHFDNVTGLPVAGQYTTPADAARLACALIRDFPEQYALFSIRTFTFAGVSQGNANRLLWVDPNIDGMAEGHVAGRFGLIASAHHDQMRLVSVVAGSGSETLGASESQRLLNAGFDQFESHRLYLANEPVTRVRIWKGNADHLPIGMTQDFYLTIPRGHYHELHATVSSRQPLLAPVHAGQQVGTLHLTLEGQVLGDYPLVALKDVGVAGMFGRMFDSIRMLLH